MNGIAHTGKLFKIQQCETKNYNELILHYAFTPTQKKKKEKQWSSSFLVVHTVAIDLRFASSMPTLNSTFEVHHLTSSRRSSHTSSPATHTVRVTPTQLSLSSKNQHHFHFNLTSPLSLSSNSPLSLTHPSSPTFLHFQIC